MLDCIFYIMARAILGIAWLLDRMYVRVEPALKKFDTKVDAAMKPAVLWLQRKAQKGGAA